MKLPIQVLSLLNTIFLFSCTNSSHNLSNNSTTSIKKGAITNAKEYFDSANYSIIQMTIDKNVPLAQRDRNFGDVSTNKDLVGYGYNSSTLEAAGKVVENENNLYDTAYSLRLARR
jgi:hypothetical protein